MALTCMAPNISCSARTFCDPQLSQTSRARSLPLARYPHNALRCRDPTDPAHATLCSPCECLLDLQHFRRPTIRRTHVVRCLPTTPRHDGHVTPHPVRARGLTRQRKSTHHTHATSSATTREKPARGAHAPTGAGVQMKIKLRHYRQDY